MKKYILGLLTAAAGFASSYGAAVSNTLTVATNAATNAMTNAAVAVASNAPAAAAATTAAKNTAKGGASYLGLAIWVAVIAALFGFLWAKGYLVKIRNYIAETQEELKKCSWPSRDELKGSTVVVLVTTLLLGLFTVGVDWILSNLIRLIT